MDVSWQNLLLVGALLLFAGFLLWKYRPSWPLFRPDRRLRPAEKREWASLAGQVREARELARSAATPRERAAALVRGAEAAALADHGVTAMGLYLRAMRADPTFCEPIQGITALLRKDKPEVLESVLWRRLAQLAWSGDTEPAARCAAEALIAVYRRELRDRDRARALRKLVALLG
jgi:hypothetical protein